MLQQLIESSDVITKVPVMNKLTKEVFYLTYETKSDLVSLPLESVVEKMSIPVKNSVNGAESCITYEHMALIPKTIEEIDCSDVELQ